MKTFNIEPVSDVLNDQLQHKIDTKTKPLGALGILEKIAHQVGSIQNTLTPKISNPAIAIFAGDHGIAEDGKVNPFPQEVTAQMCFNFLAGGAAINVFAKQNNINLTVVDAGVKHDFDDHPQLIQAKVAHGTNNYLNQPAMTSEQCQEALSRGAKVVSDIHATGSSIIGFGEMGIGNTSSASLLMSAITGIPIEECVGSGTGLGPNGINQKAEILSRVIEKHGTSESAIDLLANYGGFEIVMICGGILQAAELGMTIVIDGFIVTSALLAAAKIHPEVLDYCIFSHCSNEQGHRKMLEHFNAKPVLEFDMRLGEGTGAAMSLPVIQAAVNFLNEMASFESANVSDKAT